MGKMDYARAMYLGGHSQQDIARKFGVSENTVTAWKRKGDWPATIRNPDQTARLKKAFHLFRAGVSQQDIAQALDVTENTVTAWKKKGHWLARLALLQDKVLTESLIQLAAVAQAEVAHRVASGAHESAAALQRALTYICEQLEHPEIDASA